MPPAAQVHARRTAQPRLTNRPATATHDNECSCQPRRLGRTAWTAWTAQARDPQQPYAAVLVLRAIRRPRASTPI